MFVDVKFSCKNDLQFPISRVWYPYGSEFILWKLYKVLQIKMAFSTILTGETYINEKKIQMRPLPDFTWN